MVQVTRGGGEMVKVLIEDLEIFAFHGVLAEENVMGQKFLVTLELMLKPIPLGTLDDLERTVNYAEVCLDTESFFCNHRFQLIEKCAEELAYYLLLRYQLLQEIKIVIKKPWAPVRKHVNYVAVEVMKSWNKAYIGIGSNMGEREAIIEESLRLMDNEFSKVVQVSKLYSTKPLGYENQEDFLNCCAEIDTLLTPIELIQFLLGIEHTLKRERKVRWGPRTIDLDVLLYNDEVTESEDILIPHIRMHERLFVLQPLSELAPYLVHPLLNRRIIDLRDELSQNQTL